MKKTNVEVKIVSVCMQSKVEIKDTYSSRHLRKSDPTHEQDGIPQRKSQI